MCMAQKAGIYEYRILNPTPDDTVVGGRKRRRRRRIKKFNVKYIIDKAY